MPLIPAHHMLLLRYTTPCPMLTHHTTGWLTLNYWDMPSSML